MLYPEFDKYEPYVDPLNKLVHAYLGKDGTPFYVEPGFYDGLVGFKERREERFPEIMEAIDKLIEEHPKIIFNADFENPWIQRDGYIYREIHDITDPLLIFVEDKSRGSDYGD